MLNNLISSKRRMSHTLRLLTGDGRYIQRIKEFRWGNNNIECPYCFVNGLRL